MLFKMTFGVLVLLQVVFGQSIIVEEFPTLAEYNQMLSTQSLDSEASPRIVKRSGGKDKSELQFYGEAGKLSKTLAISEKNPCERVIFSPNREKVIVESPVARQYTGDAGYNYPGLYISRVYSNDGEVVTEFRDTYQALRFYDDTTYISSDVSWENATGKNSLFNERGKFIRTIDGVGFGYIVAQSGGLYIAVTRLGGLTGMNTVGDVLWTSPYVHRKQVTISEFKQVCFGSQNHIIVLDSLGTVQQQVEIAQEIGNTVAAISPDGRKVFWFFSPAAKHPITKLPDGVIGLYDLETQNQVWSKILDPQQNNITRWVAFRIGFIKNHLYARMAAPGCLFLDLNGTMQLEIPMIQSQTEEVIVLGENLFLYNTANGKVRLAKFVSNGGE